MTTIDEMKKLCDEATNEQNELQAALTAFVGAKCVRHNFKEKIYEVTAVFTETEYSTIRKSLEFMAANHEAVRDGVIVPQTDGEKWRALTSSPRITPMGWAGFNDDGDYRHLTLNLWTHNEGGDAQDKKGRELLEQYVTAIITAKLKDTGQ